MRSGIQHRLELGQLKPGDTRRSGKIPQRNEMESGGPLLRFASDWKTPKT
jgi:hypothetical protein